MRAYQVDEWAGVWTLIRAPGAFGSFLDFDRDSIENRPFPTATILWISGVGRLIGRDRPVGRGHYSVLRRDHGLSVHPLWCDRQA